MYQGHDVKQWDHYRTPRTCPGLHVERHSGDRLVLIVVCVIGWFLLAGIVAGMI